MKKANNQQNISQVPKKKQAEKSAIRRLVIDKKEFVKHNDMSNEIISYLKPIFERMDHIDKLDHNTLLQSVTLPPVTNDQKLACDNDLTGK